MVPSSLTFYSYTFDNSLIKVILIDRLLADSCVVTLTTQESNRQWIFLSIFEAFLENINFTSFDKLPCATWPFSLYAFVGFYKLLNYVSVSIYIILSIKSHCLVDASPASQGKYLTNNGPPVCNIVRQDRKLSFQRSAKTMAAIKFIVFAKLVHCSS